MRTVKDHRNIVIIKVLPVLFAAVFLSAGCGREDGLLEQVLDTESAAASAETGESGAAPSGQEGIWVHICGAVAAPGVYELQDGSRVCDALAAAGGFREDAAADGVNLAQKLADGEQVTIPTIEEKEQLDLVAREEEAGLVNINTASAEQLCTLTGIGKSRADSIIAYRENSGGFTTPEDIMKVTGIKEGMYAKFKDKITVGSAGADRR